MKLVILSFLALNTSIVLAEQMTSDQIAMEVIRSTPAGAYNPVDRSEEEMLRAQIFNSRLTLQHLMLAPETTEQMRICFALWLLDQQLEIVKSNSAYSSKQEELRFKQRALAKRLLEINK